MHLIIRLSKFFTLLLGAGFMQQSYAQSADPDRPLAVTAQTLEFARVFGSPGLSGPAPRAAQLSPDGRYLTLLRNREQDRERYDLWGYERESGQWRMLVDSQALGSGRELSEAEKMQLERQRIGSLKGIVSYTWAADGSHLLLPLEGELYLTDLTGGSEQLPLPAGEKLNAAISPRGRYASFVQEGRLLAFDLQDRVVMTVTPAEASADVRWGEAEFVAQEEMSRSRGFWWSPDSATLLVQQTDESGVEVRHIADPLHPETPPAKYFYPRTGTANAVVRLFLVSREGGAPKPVSWDATAFPYLAHVTWSPRAPLTILVQNRTQTEQRLLAVNTATGRTQELLRETDAAWLNLDDNGSGSTSAFRPPLWLTDGSRFLWTTERNGAWQVELRDASGALVHEITPVTFGYRRLLGVDEESGTVWVAGGEDARETHVWTFPLGGGARGRAITRGRGMHGAAYAHEARLLLRTTDLFDGMWRLDVVSADDDRVVATLPSLAEPIPRAPGTELMRTAGDPSFDAAVTRPRSFDSTAKYPVIHWVYAGPTSKTVTANLRAYLPDQWMADQGFIVVRFDGRGTPWRGRAWERAVKGNLIDTALADQISALQALAKQVPQMDLTRVGVSGWSFGGYFAAMAAIRRPDVFRCGVVGAPVITWENYDTHYTERYLGLPAEAPEAYRVSNVTTYAAEARRPLLLVHGLTDDNVYFQHTLQLADALFRAGKTYELLPMLGTHMVSDPLIRMRQQTRIMDFLQRELRR